MEDCQSLCETGTELRLADFRRVERMPLVRVDIEYPKDWTEAPVFVAKVSGKEVASRRIGGGSSPDANLATLEVFLGTAPVTELSVETAVGGKAYRVFMPLHWSVAPMLVLLDRFGRNEALLGPTELRFLLFKAGAPVVRLNGAEVTAAEIAGAAGHAALWKVSPNWAPGRNVVAVEATAADGSRLTREYSFVNLADGRLPFRQKAALAYGAPGSRSGPFYRLEAAGDAVALGADATVEVDALDDSGWPTRDQKLVREIVGAAAGEATFRIFEKLHFRGPEQLNQEIRLRVSE
jgi:hypothetical protein